MSSFDLARRVWVPLVLGAIVGAPGRTARADEVDACATASEEGQKERDRGHFIAARALFLSCVREACPAIVRADCAEWLQGVDAKMPTIVVRARDAEGHDLSGARVSVDAAPVTGHEEGRAIPIDPGPHRLTFEAEGAPTITREMVIREGEKGRIVDVTFGAISAGGKEREGQRAEPGLAIPPAAIAFGALALAGTGAFIGFGWSAKSTIDGLRASCAPQCAPALLEPAKRDQLVANISIGVAAAALTTAAVIVVFQNVRRPAASASRAGIRLEGAGFSF